MRVALACAAIALTLLVTNTSQAKPSAKKQAQVHYKNGLRAYNIGSFDEAITEWKEAYRLHGSAGFLFNIAQAYRMKNDYEQAIFFFTAYLREKPDAPNAEEVIALRKEMERLFEETKKQKEAKPNEPISPEGSHEGDSSAGTNAEASAEDTENSTETEQVVTPAPPPTTNAVDRMEPAPSSSLKTYGWITAGAGVASLATGLIFASLASSDEQELETASARGDVWNQSLIDQESSAHSKATAAKVFVGIGAAGVVAGGVLYYLGWNDDRKQRDATALHVGPLGQGATGFAISGTF